MKTADIVLAFAQRSAPTTPPPSGTLEPVNPSFAQVSTPVAAVLNQSFLGFGWGANGNVGAKEVEDRLETYADRLFTELNTKIVRVWTPENTFTFVNGYKKTCQVAKAHGVDIFLATGFIWRGKITPEKFADGVSASRAAGMPITHVGWQNEPDGHPENDGNIAGGVPWGQVVDYYQRVRARLNFHGLQDIKIIGLEWAHFAGDTEHEFDLLNAAGLIPGTVVAGAGHAYSDCPRPSIYRDRWRQHGAPLWETETGNAGLANAIARSINALNHGCATVIFHIGMVSGVPAASTEPARQSLVYGNGQRASWHGQYVDVFRNLPRGTVFRPVTCSDRPSGMTTTYAEHMVRSPGKNPRLQQACGKMPNGKWYVAAVNTTWGAGVQASHVGMCYPAATLQVTTRIAEAVGSNGTFRAFRRNAAGVSVGTDHYPLVNGEARFTLGPGEQIVLVGQ